jgi:hypothetical protein
VTEPSEYACGEMLKSNQVNAHHFDFEEEEADDDDDSDKPEGDAGPKLTDEEQDARKAQLKAETAENVALPKQRAYSAGAMAQHDGNEIQASDQHLREHHEGENLVGGSRRPAERGVPKNTSRANVGGDRQGDETSPLHLSLTRVFDTSQRL